MHLKLKKIASLLVKFLKSKVAVIATIGILLGIGFTNKSLASSDNYNFATCFQYYMLDNRADNIKSQGSNDKIANVAPLGSGGISGSFSYNDIVNSAPNKGAKITAQNFVSMMATYSTFKYFSNRVQGFESVGAYIGRFTMMLLLIPLALLMDLVQLLIPAVLKLLANLNVIPLLGSAMTSLSIKTGLTEALGLSKDTVNDFMNAFLAIAISFILISLFLALRRGSRNVDQRHLNKFKGRLFTLVCFPLVVGGAATLINEVSDMTNKVPELNSSFSRFLIDDRSWAYNYNFAPLGNDNSKSDIKGNSGSFVDLSFDPYSPNGAGEKRIASINADSSLAGDGSTFPNSSLLIAYGMSQAFSATDYINYLGSEQSLHLLGKRSENGTTSYGSYYSYATNNFSPSELLDTDNAYYPSGGKTGVKDDQKGSYASAIDDYKAKKDTLNTAQVTAWRDRFIYGAKNSGDLDKYYGDTPSQEMVKNQVGGTGTANVPSDQSMFLILSTIFDETGGRYYINAPARGIKQVQGQFDSNRSDYYVVSMVGNPFFTLIGMLTQPLMTLVVLVALLVAVFSIGLLDMNIKPLSAAFKGLTLGDIEYSGAFIFYSIGIAGTLIAFYAVPSLLIQFIQSIATLIVKAIPIATGMTPQSAQGSLAFNGSILVVQGFVAIFMAIMWWKSKKFRNALNDFFCFPWNWASGAAKNLELQAQRGSGAMYMNQNKRKVNDRMNRPILAAQRAQEKVKRAAMSALGAAASTTPLGAAATAGVESLANNKNGVVESQNENPEDSEKLPIENETENPATMSETTNNAQGQPKSPDQIKRNGKFGRIRKGLSELQTDPETSRPVVDNILDSQQAVDDFRANPNEQNFGTARDRLERLKQQLIAEGAPKSKIAKVDKAISELDGLGKSYGIDPKKFERNEPVVSKNTEEKDNDDSKFEKLQDEKNGLSDKTKPVEIDSDKIKSDKPLTSANKENGEKINNDDKDIDNSNVDNNGDGNEANKENVEVSPIKPESTKPLASTHDKLDKNVDDSENIDEDEKVLPVKPESDKPMTSAHKDNDDVDKQEQKLNNRNVDNTSADSDDNDKSDSNVADKTKEVLDDSKEAPVKRNTKDKPVVSKHKIKNNDNSGVETTKLDNKVEIPDDKLPDGIKQVTKKVDATTKPVSSSHKSTESKLDDKLKRMAKSDVIKPKSISQTNSSKNVVLDKTGQGQQIVKSTNNSQDRVQTIKSTNDSPVVPNTKGKKITQAVKTTTHQPVQPQKNNDVIDKIVEHEKVINSKETADKVKPVIRRHDRVVNTSRTLKGKVHRPVINVTDTKELKREIRNNIVKPTINHKSNYVTSNQLKGIRSALGTAINDPRIEKPLLQLRESSNLSEVKRNIRSLQKSVKALDQHTKSQINKTNLVNNLFDLQNSHKFGEK